MSDETIPREPTEADALQHKPPKENSDMGTLPPSPALEDPGSHPPNGAHQDTEADLADVKGDGNLGLTDDTTPAE